MWNLQQLVELGHRHRGGGGFSFFSTLAKCHNESDCKESGHFQIQCVSDFPDRDHGLNIQVAFKGTLMSSWVKQKRKQEREWP